MYNEARAVEGAPDGLVFFFPLLFFLETKLVLPADFSVSIWDPIVNDLGPDLALYGPAYPTGWT